MAKSTVKTPANTKKSIAPPKKAKKVSTDQLIENACTMALAKLQELDLDYQLQSEINWCLGSFRNDHNPIGLYQMAQRSLVLFKTELANKRDGVTAKLIADIGKALKAR